MKKESHLFYDFVKITGGIPALIWLRPKVIYEGGGKMPKLKGMLACGNHTSMIDPIYMLVTFWNRRMYSLATTDLYSSKLKKFFFEHVHCIPVDKTNFSMQSMHEVCDRLKEGKAVMIFPEGRVNRDSGEMLALKSGAALMAYQADVPIVPVYFMPRKKWYSRLVSLVGEPIYVRELCGGRPSMVAINSISEILRNKEIELKEKYTNGGNLDDESECESV